MTVTMLNEYEQLTYDSDNVSEKSLIVMHCISQY